MNERAGSGTSVHFLVLQSDSLAYRSFADREGRIKKNDGVEKEVFYEIEVSAVIVDREASVLVFFKGRRFFPKIAS